MRKLFAHYVFDGTAFLKYAILVVNRSQHTIFIQENLNPSMEQANVEFFNGILIPAKSSIFWIETFDFENMVLNEKSILKRIDCW